MDYIRSLMLYISENIQRDWRIAALHIKDKLKVCACVAGCLILFRCGFQYSKYGHIILDMYSFLGLAAIIVFLDILRLRPGTSFSFYKIFFHYAVQNLLQQFGYFIHRRFETMSKNIQEHQNVLLLRMLRHNSETGVGKMLGIDKVNSVDDFRISVPITTYETYEQSANKLEETGEKNVFFPGSADYIAYTSGTTTGNSKKFPKSVTLLRKTSAKWLILAHRSLVNVRGNHFLRKWLAVRHCPPVWLSKGGIKCGSITGFASNFSLTAYVAPEVVNSFQDEEVVIYINLVFGLKHPDICNLFFTTTQMALMFFHTLEANWKQICYDIESGTLSEHHLGDLSPKHVDILTKALGQGDRERSNFLRKEFKKGFKDIVPRVWPECPGLFCLATGSFKTHADVLKENYLGNVPLFSPFHASTESFYGINMHLEEPEVTYTLMTPFIFFEFIPVDHMEDENPEVLLCDEVSIGGQYELVVTTWDGLYRYRTEDVIEITGFYGTTPRYKFIRRRTELLSASRERVPEPLVSEAVRATAVCCKKQLADFVSTENTYINQLTGSITHGENYYVIFLEMRNGEVLTENEIDQVDEQLQKRHEMYKKFRDSGRLQKLKVIAVRAGTFQGIGKQMRAQSKTASLMQYKLPRIVRRPELIQYLLDCRLNVSQNNNDNKI